MRKYNIQTYGCQMNYSDTERLESVLTTLGLAKTAEMQDADLIIFNTCSIRQKAEDRVFGQMVNIPRLRKKKPHLLVGLTGCMVRKTSHKDDEDRDKLMRRMPQLDLTLRIEDLPQVPDLLQKVWNDYEFAQSQEANLENYFKINPTYSSSFQAFVPIGTGCDNFCTYCIVPYSRLREKSRQISEIVEECADLVDKGYKEITLLGQNVNSYGLSDHDKKTDYFDGMNQPFVELLKQVDQLKSKGLKRLRFTSNHPKDISNELIETMADLQTLMPYIHLPVQAGNDIVLKRMNRNYTSDWYKERVAKLRKEVPGIAISTDIIVGFCGETQEQFQDTLDLFEEVGWDMCFLAQYSTRKGTFADKNIDDDVTAADKADRWHRLNALLKKVSTLRHKEYEGKTVEVLVERFKNGICEGRSEHFKTVLFESDKDLTGQLVKVKVEKGREWLLEGKMI